MFTSKYRPNTIDEFVGNKLATQALSNWLLKWDPKNKKTKWKKICVFIKTRFYRSQFRL